MNLSLQLLPRVTKGLVPSGHTSSLGRQPLTNDRRYLVHKCPSSLGPRWDNPKVTFHAGSELSLMALGSRCHSNRFIIDPRLSRCLPPLLVSPGLTSQNSHGILVSGSVSGGTHTVRVTIRTTFIVRASVCGVRPTCLSHLTLRRAPPRGHYYRHAHLADEGLKPGSV